MARALLYTFSDQASRLSLSRNRLEACHEYQGIRYVLI